MNKANLDSIIRHIDFGVLAANINVNADKNMTHVRNLLGGLILAAARDNIYGENYTNSDADVEVFISLNDLQKLDLTKYHLKNISQNINACLS